jgi:hypothetical protein
MQILCDIEPLYHRPLSIKIIIIRNVNSPLHHRHTGEPEKHGGFPPTSQTHGRARKAQGKHVPHVSKPETHRGWVHWGHYTVKSVFSVCSMISTGEYLHSPVSKATHDNLLFPGKAVRQRVPHVRLVTQGKLIYSFFKKVLIMLQFRAVKS